MPLLVTALVVANGEVELAIVDVDIAIFTTQQDRDIRQLISGESGIPAENIRLAYSHTHSAPITYSLWLTEGLDLAAEWWDKIPLACARAAVDRDVDIGGFDDRDLPGLGRWPGRVLSEVGGRWLIRDDWLPRQDRLSFRR